MYNAITEILSFDSHLYHRRYTTTAGIFVCAALDPYSAMIGDIDSERVTGVENTWQGSYLQASAPFGWGTVR
jgi:hypothetical protein